MLDRCRDVRGAVPETSPAIGLAGIGPPPVRLAPLGCRDTRSPELPHALPPLIWPNHVSPFRHGSVLRRGWGAGLGPDRLRLPGAVSPGANGLSYRARHIPGTFPLPGPALGHTVPW